MTGKISAAIAAAILGLAIVAGCGNSGGSHAQVTACKAAMLVLAKRVASGNGASGPPAKEPEACKGLPAKELRHLFAQVMREAFSGI